MSQTAGDSVVVGTQSSSKFINFSEGNEKKE